MGEKMEEHEFINRLAEERPRIVRLCTWFTGDAQLAEDLAQETLLAAWKNQDQLSAPEKLQSWLSAIARNACFNWSRKKSREEAHLAQPTGSAESLAEIPLEEALQDEVSLELEMDRAELARLLDQALALLPAQTAHLLIEHYLQETSHAEIAEKTGLKTGTVAVKLQRGKLSLQRLLRTRLQEEALAFGLLQQENSAWENTNIWCPSCGQCRLLGQFQKEAPDARFFLRCPRCQPDPETIMVGHDLSRSYYTSLLGNIKTFKPAYTRLLSGLAPFFQQALRTNTAACLVCGRPVVVQVAHKKAAFHSPAKERSQALIHCSVCDWETNISLAGLVLALPAAQRFWRENPRMRTLESQQIEIEGVLAFVTQIQSLSGAAALTVISRQDSLAPISVHSNIPL